MRTCSSFPVGWGRADRQRQRPGSPTWLLHPSLPTAGRGMTSSRWHSGRNQRGFTCPDTTLRFLCFDPSTHLPALFLRCWVFFFFFSNGQYLLASLVVSSGILQGREPSRPRSITPKPVVSILTEMPVFENKAFSIWGFYKSGPYTPGFSPLFPSVK